MGGLQVAPQGLEREISAEFCASVDELMGVRSADTLAGVDPRGDPALARMRRITNALLPIRERNRLLQRSVHWQMLVVAMVHRSTRCKRRSLHVDRVDRVWLSVSNQSYMVRLPAIVPLLTCLRPFEDVPR